MAGAMRQGESRTEHRGSPWLPKAPLQVGFTRHFALLDYRLELSSFGVMLSPSIFKAYDIRGVVDDTLRPEDVFQIGRALASEAFDRGFGSFVVGRDGRLSGPRLLAALVEGLRASGADVIDLGMVATPMVYFGTETLDARCGVMVTGSHNPPDYNGLKMVVGNEALYSESILALYQRILREDFVEGAGGYRELDIGSDYIARIARDIKLKVPLSIVVDCGNGVAGAFAKKLYEAIGCSVKELFCEVDGTFPNHHPDPADPHNLEALIASLKNGDGEIGLAFDGDGDRLGVVTRAGEIIFPDRQLMMFAEDVLSRVPGASIIFDVKCTRNLAPSIRRAGGQPLMWKTGHSLVKAKLRETGAPLAGEMSGHMFFKERWYGFDDGLYAGARLLEILSAEKASGHSIDAKLEALPNSVSTPELQLKLAEGENIDVIDRLQRVAHATFASAGADNIHLIDGVRVDYPDGFGLARASNTTPVIVLRFEGDDKQALTRIQTAFRNILLELKPDAVLPF
jgi:phosphomannomutase/phosphoglucomutase